jgi:hypothetical protein
VTRRIVWSGELPILKWTQFYMKVLTRFAGKADVKAQVRIEIEKADGVSDAAIRETEVALRELGLDDRVEAE